MRSLSLLMLALAASSCQPQNSVTSTTNKANGPQVALPAAPIVTASPDTVVATWQGGQITYGEVESKVKGRLTRMEIDYLSERHTLLSKTIDNALNDALLKAEAAQRGLTDVEALLNVEINEKIVTVSDGEVEKFYAKNKKRFRNKPLDDVREDVYKRALDEKRSAATVELIDHLREQADVQISLAPPDLPRIDVPIDDDFVRGNPDAKVTIVEFAEYQCPYCARGYRTMKDVMEAYDGQVRWVFRDFPLSFHRNAIPAAIAANCAGAQGKYWEMHDLLLGDQKSLNEAGMETHAKTLGLDLATWKTCTEDDQQKKEIMADMAAGQSFGVTGTPAYFINGIMLSGARPLDSFKEVIDRELAASGG